MQTQRIRRIFLITGILSLLISYLGIWIRLINDPVERTGADFIHFYAAGRIAQQYGAAHVYDLKLQHDVEQEQVGFALAAQQVLPYNHLPFLIPALQVVMSSNYIASFYRWDLLMILIYMIGILLLSRVLKQSSLEASSIQIVGAGALLFLPVFISLMNGQDTALLFLGAAIWVYGLASGKELMAGLGLSLTTVRPHIALLLALPMLFRYRRIFWGFVLGSGVLAILSFLIVGIQGTRAFIHLLLLTAGGEWYGTHQNAMLNLIGLLLRVFPWLGADTIRIIGWVVYGLSLIGLCFLWWRSREKPSNIIGLTVILAVFVAPHLHSHDLTLLLIPIYELIRTQRESEKPATSLAVLIPIGISILLLVGNISPYLQFTFPYLIMATLAGYLASSNVKNLHAIQHQTQLPRR